MKHEQVVDVEYLTKELQQLQQTLADRRPEELARYLRALADVVEATYLGEGTKPVTVLDTLRDIAGHKAQPDSPLMFDKD